MKALMAREERGSFLQFSDLASGSESVPLLLLLD